MNFVFHGSAAALCLFLLRFEVCGQKALHYSAAELKQDDPINDNDDVHEDMI